MKKQIIESATKHFSGYGFHKTTMDEIARDIHKAKGVLYYYFRSKEELFNEVLKQELDKLKAPPNLNYSWIIIWRLPHTMHW